MYSLNRAAIIGNLTRDPELRQTPSGTNVATIGVATNRKWTGQDGQSNEETEFHNVVAWGKLAQICADYLKKGVKVYFEGRLKTRSWESEDGHKNYRTEIIAENMIILQRKDGEPVSFSGNNPPPPADAEMEQGVKSASPEKGDGEAASPEGAAQNEEDKKGENASEISVNVLPF